MYIYQNHFLQICLGTLLCPKHTPSGPTGCGPSSDGPGQPALSRAPVASLSGMVHVLLWGCRVLEAECPEDPGV